MRLSSILRIYLGMIMQLLNKIVLVGLLAASLQGCQLGEDDELDDEIEVVYLTTDETYGTTLSNSVSAYKLSLQANKNTVTLKDDIAEISIKGNLSTITIDSDTDIDSITITGDGNTIEVKDLVNLTVTNLKILGDGNDISVYEIVNTPTISSSDGGVDNVVCEANGAICL